MMRLFTPSHTAHLSLGVNIGDRLATLSRAALAIAEADCEVTRVSPVYETAPMYLHDQPSFLNMAATIRTPLTAQALLAHLNGIERAAGRVRDGQRNGPRPLDIDILTYDDAIISADDLTIPHPGLAERAFVLVPLATIAHDLIIPGSGPSLGRTVSALLDEVANAETVIRHAPPPAAGQPMGDSYTIFLRDLTAPLVRAATNGPPPTARITAKLDVQHPGRQFADDIAAVLSYEDVVLDLRHLCATTTKPDPAALALAATDLALTHPRVRAVEVKVLISQEEDRHDAPPNTLWQAETSQTRG